MPNSNTQTLLTSLGNAADAIRAKDGTQNTMTVDEMAARIAAIPSGGGGGGGFDVSSLTGFKCYNQSNYDFSSLDTSGFTNMREMFSNCSTPSTLDVTNFDTSSVQDMYRMFYGCANLTNLDLSSFNTANVENVSQMLASCSSLLSVNLARFDCSSCSSQDDHYADFIQGASIITTIIWAIEYDTVKDMPPRTSGGKYMFSRVNGVSTFYFYVRDSLLNAYKTAPNFSVYANWFKPISQLPLTYQTLYNIDPNDYQ